MSATERQAILDESQQQENVQVLPIIASEDRPSCVPFRYWMSLMSSLGFILAMSTRTSFNIALVAMVKYKPDDGKNTSDCPLPPPAENHTVPGQGGEFPWNSRIQDQLLSGFFYGYVVTQIPGGLLAEKVSGKMVFGGAVLIPGVISLLQPTLARWDYGYLLASRVLMGLFQGPLYPSNLALYGRWAPREEGTRLVAITLAGAGLGLMIAIFLSGYLCSLPYLDGWPLPFYVFGVLSCCWFVVWVLFAADSPVTSFWISTPERQYLTIQTGLDNPQEYIRPPYVSIFRSKAVWGLLGFCLCDGVGYYVIYNGVPIYMKRVLHFDISQEGELLAVPYLISFILSLIVGPLADFIIIKQCISRTNVRKMFTALGDGIVAFVMFGIGMSGCNYTLATFLLIFGSGMNGLLTAGVSIITLDMCPRYAGTLTGLTNFCNNIGGFVSPYIIRVITNNEGHQKHWQELFYVTAAVFLVGVLIFLFTGDADIQKWNDPEDMEEDQSEESINELPEERTPLLS